MRYALAIFAVLFLVSSGAGVDGLGQACAADGGLSPHVPKAKSGTTCVRDGAYMRRNHMQFLVHGRDSSVRDGARREKESFRACLSCHAVPDGKGQAVSFKSPQHFCRTCHDYAAVRIDCFECHNSKPDGPLFQSNAAGGQTK